MLIILCAESIIPVLEAHNLTAVEGMHQFIIYIVYVVQRVRGGRGF